MKKAECHGCKVQFTITKNRNKKHKFCTRNCYVKWLSKTEFGVNNPNWKGGKTKAGTEYVFILVSKGKYVGEHRINMERSLGRKLKTDEIVHHKNHDKSDNRIKNLQIVSRAEHVKLHKPRKKVYEARKRT